MRAVVYLGDCQLQLQEVSSEGWREGVWRGKKHASRKAQETKEILATEIMGKNSGRAWGSDVHISTYVLHEAGTENIILLGGNTLREVFSEGLEV